MPNSRDSDRNDHTMKTVTRARSWPWVSHETYYGASRIHRHRIGSLGKGEIAPIIDVRSSPGRRIHAFQASDPASRPPPVNFSPRMLHQSRHRCADIDVGNPAIGAHPATGTARLRSRSLVKIAEIKPCSTAFCIAMASSIAIGHHVEDRRERLLADDRHDPGRALTSGGSTKNPGETRLPPKRTSPPCLRAARGRRIIASTAPSLISGPIRHRSSQGSPIRTRA